MTIKVFAYPRAESGYCVECPALDLIAQGETLAEAMLAMRTQIRMTHDPQAQVELCAAGSILPR